jgi:hypothetical protein
VRLVTFRSSWTIQALALGVLAWLAAPCVFGSPQAAPSPRQYLQIVCRKFALDDGAVPAAGRNKLKAPGTGEIRVIILITQMGFW